MNEIQTVIDRLEAKRAKLAETISLLRQFDILEPVAPAPQPEPPAAAATRSPKPKRNPGGWPKLAKPTTNGGNVGVKPFSPEGIAIGRSLEEPFMVADLKLKLDGHPSRPYYWLEQWSSKGWVEQSEDRKYHRTPTFGQ